MNRLLESMILGLAYAIVKIEIGAHCDILNGLVDHVFAKVQKYTKIVPEFDTDTVGADKALA